MAKQNKKGEDDELKPMYWDDVKKMPYWIEWYDTGNGEIPTRHYIRVVAP
jgi:hypothetical protein